MATSFKYFIKTDGTVIELLVEMSPSCFVHIDSGSTQWPNYLAWLAEGNEPEEWTDGN